MAAVSQIVEVACIKVIGKHIGRDGFG